MVNYPTKSEKCSILAVNSAEALSIIQNDLPEIN